MEMDDSFRDKADIGKGGEQGEEAANNEEITADGQGSRAEAKEQDTESQEPHDRDDTAARLDPFRKLGDALERWHRQQQEIKEASDDPVKDQSSEGIADREFQHVQDEDDAGDSEGPCHSCQ